MLFARQGPTALWGVGLNYGIAGTVALGSVMLFDVVPAASFEQRLRFYIVVQESYVVGAVVFTLTASSAAYGPACGGGRRGELIDCRTDEAGRRAPLRGGRWGRRERLDVCARLAGPLAGFEPSWPQVGLAATTGFAVLIPIAVSALGEVVRGLLGALTALAIAAAAFAAVEAVARPLAALGLGGVSIAVAAAILAIAMVPLWSRVRAALEWMVFRRSRRRGELQAFLHRCRRSLERAHALAGPSRRWSRCCAVGGRRPCCRRGGHEPRDAGGGTVAARLASWRRARDRGRSRVDGLRARRAAADLRALVSEAGVSAVLALRSPRRDWGQLFIASACSGPRSATRTSRRRRRSPTSSPSCSTRRRLLARAVAVERSLAHAEKLAAVGETAARIAHEIRNPVTAARSLAQQLARDAAVSEREDATVIVEELDRVERQVAALLRFSRREEFRFEAVDLGALARGSLEPLRSRLNAEEVRVELDAPHGVVARRTARRCGR